MNGREAEVSGRGLGLSGSSEVQAVLLKTSCERVMPYTGMSQTLGCHNPGSLEGRVSWVSYSGERQEGYGTCGEHRSMCGTSWLFHTDSESAVLQPGVSYVVQGGQ